MTLTSNDNRLWTRVSPGGKSMAGAIGMKPGGGGDPQPYDGHGQYLGAHAAVSMRTGAIRVAAGTLLAARGKTRTGAGGISGGSVNTAVVRGPAAKPEATVTWKNDEQGKPDPKPEELQPHLRETVEKMCTGVPELERFNVNSGYREPLARHDPHAEGRAVDVNRINDIPVKELENAQGAEGDKARKAAQNLEAWTRDQPEVNQVLGPNGGWEFKGGKKTDILKSDPRTKDHLDHYHINVWKVMPPKSSRQ